MSDTMRMTGLFSGMDTESIISALVSTKAVKVTNLKNEQTKLKWKQEAWQGVNSKVYSMYSGSLSSMRLTGAYSKNKTKVSDSTKATVTASETAVIGSQTLEIKSLAASGYLTGAKLKRKATTTETTNEDGTTTSKTSYSNWTGEDKLSDVVGSAITGQKISVATGLGTEDEATTEIEITDGMTVTALVNKLKETGLNASFDETNQRFFVSSKSSGAANGFEITNSDASGTALSLLGMDATADYGKLEGSTTLDNKCVMQQASDAVIELNGATFTSQSNTFTINGLTITANALTETDSPITISTDKDYDGIYDMIKDMLSEYNDVINDIYKRYNADSARKYNMLSDDEKEAMTDDQVEEWEDTIKGSLLRRDNDLYTIMNAFTEAMSGAYEVNGEKKYLTDFGIGTLSYFEAEDNERKALHIDGDSDDEKTSANSDKLKAAIASDPEGTIEFFSKLCQKLYGDIGTIMTRSEYRSVYKVYDDKQLQSDYDSYTKKISEAQEKLEDYEDKYYDKFSSMEVALSKLQSSQNALSGMLGS